MNHPRLLRCGRHRLLTAAMAALTLFGCASGGDGGAAGSGTTAPSTGCEPLEPSTVPVGAPDFEMPTEVKPVLETVDLEVGKGREVVAGDTVVAHYVGVSCSTGEVFDSSWSWSKPSTFSLQEVIKGWQQGVPGMRVGGRRMLVVPPALGYGNQPPRGSRIKPNETLVFVIELQDIRVDAPQITESAAGKPCVAANDVPPVEDKPEVPVPLGPPPSELRIEDLVVGDGGEAKPGTAVRVHYVGIACSTGRQFDASWDRAKPAEFRLDEVIPGWQQGIPGMKVGGRRLLVVPPALAYGPEGRPGIAPDETLVFVVDLLEVDIVLPE